MSSRLQAPLHGGKEMAMQDRSRQRSAGGGEAGTPVEPPAAPRGDPSRRYGVAERKALLDELSTSGETVKAFCARKGVSTAWSARPLRS